MSIVQNIQMKTAALSAALLCSCTLAYAQTRTVTGTVVDNQGEPLAGVNIVEKGTSNGTMTDIDGKYSLSVATGKTLVFSFIGYTSQEVVASNSKINVTMSEDSELLEDVVVIGYGSMQRKDLTSSITTVKSEELNVGAYSSPSELLQGKVPGLVITTTSDPNGSGSISLRGASSLREGDAMQPYYVVDGVPGVDLSLIAPDDIESIDVLRDATATAIYGSKAANGVIIVTTKKGKKGDGYNNVSYSGYVAFDKTLKTLDMMTGSELLNYAKQNNVDLSPFYDTSNVCDNNWQDEVLRTGLTHSHSLNISGGHGNSSYSASVNYLNKQGVVEGTRMNRFNLRSFVQTSLFNNHLDLSASVNASVTNNHAVPTSSTNGQSVLDAMYYYSPLLPAKNADGTWAQAYQDYGVSQCQNPVAMANEDQYGTENKFLQAIGKATWHIIEGLSLNGTFSYQNGQWNHNNYNSSASGIAQWNNKNGIAQRYTTEDIKKQMEVYANYDKVFAEKHKLGLMAGYSWEQNDTADGYGLTVYDFYSDATQYYNLGLANKINIEDDGIWSSAMSSLRMISFYGRVNYSYNSRYLLQATIRRDGSSAFGTNNRWATFPSVSLAWNVAEEEFMKNQNVLSDLKLRVGYGVSGNSLGFDAYTAVQTYGQLGWFNYTDANGDTQRYRKIGATSNTNPDLKWESTGMFNVGLDFGFLNHRITGTIEYYDKETSDLIYGYQVPTTKYIYGWLTANVGEIANKGVEFSLNADIIRTKDFTWASTINISHNKNTVKKLSNGEFSTDYIEGGKPDVGGYATGDEVQRIEEGGSIGDFYVWEWAGYDDSGKSIFNDYDENGNLVGTTDAPDRSDKRYHGNAQPKVTYSWNNTFNYKNWSLTAFFSGVAGNKIYNATRNYYNNVTLMNTGKNMLAEVMTEQRATDTRAQAPSDRYLENGSYLRLKSLSLSYTWKNLSWTKALKLYATCNNVFTITGYKGVDPEVNLGGLTPGMDWRNSTYPQTRSFMLGVNVNF